MARSALMQRMCRATTATIGRDIRHRSRPWQAGCGSRAMAPWELRPRRGRRDADGRFDNPPAQSDKLWRSAEVARADADVQPPPAGKGRARRGRRFVPDAASAGPGPRRPGRLAGGRGERPSGDRVVLGKTGIKLSRLAMGSGTHGTRKTSMQARLGVYGFGDLLEHAYDQGSTSSRPPTSTAPTSTCARACAGWARTTSCC